VGPYLTTAFFAALVVAQTAVMPHAALGASKPLLPLLAVVSWGLLRGPMAALWWALGLGILLDALSPTHGGFYTLPLLAAGLVVILGRSRLFPSNFALPGIIAALATVAFTTGQRVFLHIASGGLPGIAWTPAALADDVLPPLVLNLLWLPILYFPLRVLAERTGPRRMEWGR
jgi:rod shape-determining protein MreD